MSKKSVTRGTKARGRSAAGQPSAYSRFLAAWVAFVSRAAGWVVALCLAGTTVLTVYTVRNLGVNTSASDMLSSKLEYRKTYEAYKKAFPNSSRRIIIVIDASDGDRAIDAADALYQRLLREPKTFEKVLYQQGDPFFKRNGLLYLSFERLAKLSDRLSEAQPMLAALARDPSLRGLFGVLGDAIENLDRPNAFSPERREALERTLNRIASSVEAGARQGKASPLSWTRVLSEVDDAGTAHRRIIVVQPVLDYSSLQPAKRVMTAIRDIARELRLTPGNGVRVRLTGAAAINTEELRSVATGATRAGIISLVLVAILLVVGLRSLRLVLAVLGTLIVGLLWTAGFAAVSVGSLNLLSVAGFVLFIGLGVDFGIHYALRYREARQKRMAIEAALRDAATGVGGALTLSAATAAIAFYSFMPTAYRGVSELGLIAGTGMFIAFIANFTLLPALLTLLSAKTLPKRRAKTVGRGNEPSEKALTWAVGVETMLQKRGGWITAFAILLALGALLLLPGARFDRNPLNLKDFKTESVSTVRELMKDSSTMFYTAAVVAKDRAEADRLVPLLRKLPAVAKVRTIDNYVPKQQKRKLEIIDDMATLLGPTLEKSDTKPPTTHFQRLTALREFRSKLRKAIARQKTGNMAPTLRRVAAAVNTFLARRGTSMKSVKDLEDNLTRSFPGRLASLKQSLKARPIKRSDLPQAMLRREVSADGRIRVTVYPREDLLGNAALRRFADAVRSVAPNATGTPIVELEAGDAVVTAFRQATFIALALIGVFLLLVLRSVSDSLLVFAPLTLAALLTGATAVATGLSFNFANVIVLPLLLGLGVASGIHIVMRARMEKGMEILTTSTPRAVLFSALTTVASFGSLTVSTHRGTASMGELLFIAISYTLICSLLFLPALMAVVADLRAAPPPAPKKRAGPAKRARRTKARSAVQAS